ncbi:hypothetical protein HME9302_01894 [Alteripontixanthobacter maritimus]|uniref:DoxX family membrane protein n=1 Tax=Alteripontixanthobacter maritimus TaxID=2161824 RepID=A0A369QCP1_9SPHN|nr:DoxX family protein [Alteripontixanthobacter maritimus]RDC60679.1 hypothetical protein HME9302_01894 [Alteripontixanthobacter maritimus]
MTRNIFRVLLALFYGFAGYRHLVDPAPFLSITPDWVPAKAFVVAFTGWAELAGAAGLLQPWSKRLRRAAGIGLALYALCVWPANVNHMMMYLDGTIDGPSMAYHGPRMVAQPLIIWLALWVGEATDWPLRRKTRAAAGMGGSV